MSTKLLTIRYLLGGGGGEGRGEVNIFRRILLINLNHTIQ